MNRGPSGMGRQGRKAIRWLRVVAQVVLSLAILAWLIQRLTPGAVFSRLEEARGWRLGVAFLFHFFALGISLIRWQCLLRPLDIRLSWFAVGWVYVMGGFFNSFLPTGIGGDAVRIYKAGTWSGRKAAVAASVVVERWTGMIAFLVLCLTALGLGAYEAMGIEWTLGILGITLSLIGFLILLLRRPEPIMRRGALIKVRKKWFAFRHAVSEYRTNLKPLAWALGWALGVQGILILYYAVLGWALGMDGRFNGYAVVVPLSELVSMIPINVGGFGTREAVFVGFAKTLGLTPEQAFLLALVRGVFGVLFNMMGVVTLWYPYTPSAARTPAGPGDEGGGNVSQGEPKGGGSTPTHGV